MDVEVWPENWPVLQLFWRLDTQWRVGMNGPAGLAYEAVYPLLDRLHPSEKEWWQALDDIQHMERIALETMRKH